MRANTNTSGPTMRPGAGWTADGKAWAGPISCRPGPHESHCVGAIDYAQGGRISFAGGSGQMPVAHEAAHVVQQSPGRATGARQF